MTGTTTVCISFGSVQTNSIVMIEIVQLDYIVIAIIICILSGTWKMVIYCNIILIFGVNRGLNSR